MGLWNPIAGLQALCIQVIEDARKNIKGSTPLFDGMPEPFLDALWLLCDARDTIMPLAYGDHRSETLYRVIRTEVFQSKGFHSLMKKIVDPENCDGKLLAAYLDKARIFD